VSGSEQIAWAAGLFEGEGSFTQRSRRYGKGRYPSASLAMTDEDVVRRFHEIVGMGNVNGPYDHGGNKLRWRWEIGVLQDFREFVEMMSPWLGTRRSGRALELLAEEEGHVTERGQAISRGRAVAKARRLAA